MNSNGLVIYIVVLLSCGPSMASSRCIPSLREREVYRTVLEFQQSISEGTILVKSQTTEDLGDYQVSLGELLMPEGAGLPDLKRIPDETRKLVDSTPELNGLND